MNDLDLILDPDHPTPLYHQIATAVRWKIGTGELEPGDLLPPLRAAADSLGVSYHTVRRAYSELARLGLVRSTRGDGTRVLSTEADVGAGAAESVEAFVAEFVSQVRRRYGLRAPELAGLIRQMHSPESPARAVPDEGPAIFMVECNDHQASDLAAQIEERLARGVVPWNLLRDGEPPEGVIVGTRFHQGDMLERWSHRAPDMVFVALRLDEALLGWLARAVEDEVSVTLVEEDVGTAHQHAAALAGVGPTGLQVKVTTELPGALELDRTPGLFAIAPRLYDSLAPELRDHPRILVLRHVLRPEDWGVLERTLEAYSDHATAEPAE